MTRIVVVGAGPLPFERSEFHTAASARTWQFASALVEGGVEVELLVVATLRPGESSREIEHSGVLCRWLDRATESDPGAIFNALQVSSPAAVVGASTYPSYLAARCGYPAPLWVDFFGDPMAEGQALASIIGSDQPILDAWWMATWCLRRGDRFSAVSNRQRFALLGQLGLAGRLGRSSCGSDLAEVVPSACPVPDESASTLSEGDFTILFSGSFNSWVDGETLAGALELALTENPRLRFVATGGTVPGMDEREWHRFCARLSHLGFESSRLRLLGRISSSDLERIERETCCGIVAERPSLERELGVATRALRWMALGIPVVTTRVSEMGITIAERSLGLAYEPGNPRALADALLRLESDRSLARALGANGRAWVSTHHSISRTTQPLRRWVENPKAAPDRLDGWCYRSAKRLPEMLLDQLHLESTESRRR